MADKKISELTEKTALVPGDIFAIVDSEATPVETKKITFNRIHSGVFTELTIAGGAITVTGTRHSVDTQADAASDDLDTINGGVEGMEITLIPENGARTVVIKHNTGNIWLKGEGDLSLDDADDAIKLVYNGSKWCDVGAGGGLDNTAGGTDALLTKAPTSNVLYDHANSIISSTVHPNTALFIGYVNPGVATVYAATYIKIPKWIAVSDPGSGLDVSDWYGASGAYRQSDADSDATHIQDDDAVFPSSIKYSFVRWASNAAGDANVGTGTVSDVDADTLTIVKHSGANFAASYYYWITHNEWVVPTTGLYLFIIKLYWSTAEVDKTYYSVIMKYTGTSAPGIVSTDYVTSPVAATLTTSAVIVSLNAGDRLVITTYQNGTNNVPSLAATGDVKTSWFLLKQTA